METPPPSGIVPDHLYKAQCQFATCRQPVGAVYLPFVGGVVVFPCHACRNLTVFHSTAGALVSYLVSADRRTVLDKNTGRPLSSSSSSATAPGGTVRKKGS